MRFTIIVSMYFLLPVGCRHQAPAPVPVPAPAPAPADLAGRVLNLVNAARHARNLPPLVADARLARAAQVHSDDMAAHRSLSHAGSDGSNDGQRIEAAGYPFVTYGACVALGQSADQVVAMWLASPPHRAILLGNYRDIGIGVSGTYWTADLGIEAH